MIKKTCFFASVFFLMLLADCVSSKKEEQPYSVCTDEDILDLEIERIYRIEKESPVKALWYACMTGLNFKSDAKVEELKNYCQDSIVSKTKALISEDKLYQAGLYLQSLNAAAPELIKSGALSEELNTVKAFYSAKNAEALSKKNPQAKKALDWIDGTVTIWVDKGVRVEKGIGYADRVIGSGFFIDKNGYIITNHHVIESEVSSEYEGYSRLYIKLAEDSETRIPAKVIGWDPVLDLSLLKTEVTPPYVFDLGSSANLEPGDQIYAIGSPVGLEKTLTSGIVSSTDRSIGMSINVIQIDAAVNSGNSGGPLIDKNGTVQAVVFAGLIQYEGLNFAIPIEYLKNELPALYAGGEIKHPWFGVYGHTEKYYPSDKKGMGVVINYVMPGSFASLAGLKTGNIITKVEDTRVTNASELTDVLMSLGTDVICRVSYLENKESGEEKDVLLYLEQRPENPGYKIYCNDSIERVFLPVFGMDISRTSSYSKKGIITSVLKGSIADESGFSENDPIQIIRTRLLEKNSVLYAEVYTKKRKNGYLDVNIGIAAPLDSPGYF